MSFRPLHDRILVRRVDSEEKTKGGIIIPDTAKEKPQKARLSPSAPARAMMLAQVQPLDVRWATASCSASGPGTEIKITAKTC